MFNFTVICIHLSRAVMKFQFENKESNFKLVFIHKFLLLIRSANRYIGRLSVRALQVCSK